MQTILRLVPGILGALAGFVVLKLIAWTSSVSFQVIVFLGAYLAVHLSVDTALRRYGRENE